MRPIDRWLCSGPRRAVDVRVLHDQRHRDEEAEQHRHRDRHAHDDQRRTADDHVDHLVQRMAQHAVHAVEAADAVMHRMQPPQRRELVAEVVHHHEGEVGDDERDQQLRPQRPLGRPEALEGEQPDDQRDEQHAVDALHLVDEDVQEVRRRIAVVVVVVPVIEERRRLLGGEGGRVGKRQQRREPQIGPRVARATTRSDTIQ